VYDFNSTAIAVTASSIANPLPIQLRGPSENGRNAPRAGPGSLSNLEGSNCAALQPHVAVSVWILKAGRIISVPVYGGDAAGGDASIAGVSVQNGSRWRCKHCRSKCAEWQQEAMQA
jgi:hypothetical protein